MSATRSAPGCGRAPAGPRLDWTPLRAVASVSAQGRTQSAERAMPTQQHDIIGTTNLLHARRERTRASLSKELRMDTLPLPPRPDLAQYRKRAKGLVSAARSGGDTAVREWAAEWIESLRALLEPVTPFVQASCDRAVAGIEKRVRRHSNGEPLTLATAQFMIAQAHGFASWADLSRHVERIGRDPQSVPFEAAADAIVGGELQLLEALLAKHPELILARSARVHRATLLHYVAANGVEDFRQKTPANAVAVARLLLESGAEVDALAETYGGGPLQTTLNLLVSSVHPAAA